MGTADDLELVKLEPEHSARMFLQADAQERTETIIEADPSSHNSRAINIGHRARMTRRKRSIRHNVTHNYMTEISDRSESVKSVLREDITHSVCHSKNTLTTSVRRQRVLAGARGSRAACRSHTLILLHTQIHKMTVINL